MLTIFKLCICNSNMNQATVVDPAVSFDASTKPGLFGKVTTERQYGMKSQGLTVYLLTFSLPFLQYCLLACKPVDVQDRIGSTWEGEQYLLVDPSAAEFRRHSQPAPCRAATAGKNSGRCHASQNLLTPPPPQFLRRAVAQVILTHCDTCSSFIMKLSNSLFGS